VPSSRGTQFSESSAPCGRSRREHADCVGSTRRLCERTKAICLLTYHWPWQAPAPASFHVFCLMLPQRRGRLTTAVACKYYISTWCNVYKVKTKDYADSLHSYKLRLKSHFFSSLPFRSGFAHEGHYTPFYYYHYSRKLQESKHCDQCSWSLHSLFLADIDYWHDTLLSSVCLSVRPSVCLWRCALWLNDTSHSKTCLNKWIL